MDGKLPKNCILCKLLFKTKMTKVFLTILLMKSSGSNFIFLIVFYLIIWVMKAPKNFGKITILKILELIFLGGVKIHFGKLALKWCIFRQEKKCFNWYYDVAFYQIKNLTLKAPQSDGLNLSFVKYFHTVGTKMARNGHKMAIYNFLFFLELAKSLLGIRLHFRP